MSSFGAGKQGRRTPGITEIHRGRLSLLAFWGTCRALHPSVELCFVGHVGGLPGIVGSKQKIGGRQPVDILVRQWRGLFLASIVLRAMCMFNTTNYMHITHF